MRVIYQERAGVISKHAQFRPIIVHKSDKTRIARALGIPLFTTRAVSVKRMFAS